MSPKSPKPSKSAKRASPADSEAAFQAVVDAFARDKTVTRETGKGFGSGSLKVNGKIFAMISASRGEFVVKLPKARVDALIEEGIGQRFDPGHGRIMKEWLAVTASGANWIDLAKEAHRFVKQRS
jgi:hypothetical protein